MTRLFKRTASVTIARPVSGSFFQTQPNAIVVRDLRVQFTVAKDIGSEPNTCEIILTNLAERTRSELQKLPLQVRLDVGYDDDHGRLFIGDLRWAFSRRTSADWETKLQVGDGHRAYRYARVNRSYREGVDAFTAVNETVRAMQLTPKFSVAATQALRAQYAAGLSLYGRAEHSLTQLLSPYGLTWSIQDGRIQILFPDEVRSDQPILISQDTGMVGVPEFGAPPKRGAPPTLYVTTLIQPRITPAGRIQVESDAIEGRFRVQRVTHRGDTRGTQWFSDIEAVPL